jgi:hypothetical protein
MVKFHATLAATFSSKHFHLVWAWSKGGFIMTEFCATLAAPFPVKYCILILRGMKQ